MEQPPVGSLLYYGTRIVQVNESSGPVCKDCLFASEKEGFGSHFSCRNLNWGCTPYQRKDKKHVIFKLMSPINYN